MTQYSVFILKNGEWQQVMASASKDAAEREKDYLRRAMNLNAEVFKREV